MEQWLAENWLNIFTIVFGSGLWFAAFSIHRDSEARKKEAKARRASNLIAITANYLEVWKIYILDKELQRVLDPKADIAHKPITFAERVFVNLAIQQANSAYYTMSDRLVVEYDGLRGDIAGFFSLPIPKAVWRKAKQLQNHDFAAFIEAALK